MNEYWGELPSILETDSGIIAVERAQITRIRPLKAESIKMDFRYNSSNGNNDDNEDNYLESCVSDVPIGNPFMLHTIKLLQFMRQLNTNRDSISAQSLPELVQTDHKLFNKYISTKINNKSLNQKAVKQLVRRSLILITVFYGYENTTESILDLLVDITCEYLSRMCQSIRSATDSIELRSSNDFVDVIDRVFHDMNVPDFESLRQYDSDIRLYNHNLMKDILRKMGSNQSINSQTKTYSSELPVIENTDISPHISVNTPSDARDLEQTLSLRSLLNSNKVLLYDKI